MESGLRLARPAPGSRLSAHRTWLCVAFALVVLNVSAVQAGSSSTYRGIGVYVLNLAEQDLAHGSFYADVLIYMKSVSDHQVDNKTMHVTCGDLTTDVQTATDWSPYFVNSGNYFKLVDERTHYRMMGKFYYNVSLADFPFDEQHLEILIEDTTEAVETLKFCHLPEYSGISSTIRYAGQPAADLTYGFEIHDRCWPPFSGVAQNSQSYDDRNWSGHVFDECQYSKKRYSEYSFFVKIKRPQFKSFIKYCLPPLCVYLVVLYSYMLPASEYTSRISISGSSLVSTVLFHAGLDNNMPTNGVLTFGDRFMIIMYTLIVLSFNVNVVILNSRKRNKHDYSDMIAQYAEHFSFIGSPIMFSFLFVEWYYGLLLLVLGVVFSLSMTWLWRNRAFVRHLVRDPRNLAHLWAKYGDEQDVSLMGSLRPSSEGGGTDGVELSDLREPR